MVRCIAAGIWVAMLFLSACTAADDPVERTGWWEGGPGAPGLRVDHNFYQSDIERYPEFGLIDHSIDVMKYSVAAERAALANALTLCRHDFGPAYRQSMLTTIDAFGTDKKDWLSGAMVIRFTPKWVVVVLTNFRDKGPDRSIPSLKRIYKVGMVFSAADVFNENVPIAKVCDQGFRDEDPLDFDFSAKYPVNQVIFTVIDRFRATMMKKSPK